VVQKTIFRVAYNMCTAPNTYGAVKVDLSYCSKACCQRSGYSKLLL